MRGAHQRQITAKCRSDMDWAIATHVVVKNTSSPSGFGKHLSLANDFTSKKNKSRQLGWGMENIWVLNCRVPQTQLMLLSIDVLVLLLLVEINNGG